MRLSASTRSNLEIVVYAGIFVAIMTLVVMNATKPSHSATAEVPGDDSVSALVVESLVNDQRSKVGIAPLESSSSLRESACAKAEDMLKLDYWAHRRPDGSGKAGDFMDAAGFSWGRAGENLYYFSGTPDPVAGWMSSDGHRANMLNPDVTRQGICLREGAFQGKSHVNLYVQHLAMPLSEMPQGG